MGAAKDVTLKASWFHRLNPNLAIAVQASTDDKRRVGVVHDVSPFTTMRYALDEQRTFSVSAQTVLNSSVSATFGIELPDQKDLKWGVSIKFE